MSKEFNNEKIITSKHDDTMNLLKDKGIPKSNCISMTWSTTRGRSRKKVVEDNIPKCECYLDGPDHSRDRDQWSIIRPAK